MISWRTVFFAMALMMLGCIPYAPASYAAAYALLVWPIALVLALVPQRILLAIWRGARPDLERGLGRVLGLLAIATLVSAGILSSGHADPRDTITGALVGLLGATSYAIGVVVTTRVWLCRRDGAPSALFGPQLVTSVIYAVSAALIHAGVADRLELRWYALLDEPGPFVWLPVGVFTVLCAEALIRRPRGPRTNGVSR